MSLAVLGTAANVFGAITPAKDAFEIFKFIVDSLEEVAVFLKLLWLLLTAYRKDVIRIQYLTGT